MKDIMKDYADYVTCDNCGCETKNEPQVLCDACIEYSNDMQVAVPMGWKLVPIDPTEEMMRAFWETATSHEADDCWARMLAAAPAFDATAKPELPTNAALSGSRTTE